MNSGILQPVRTRLMAWLGLRSGLLVIGVVGGLALAATIVDAAVDLPEQWRALVPWVLGACALVILASAAAAWMKLDEYRLARWFERTRPSLGNQLVNAVQLSHQPGASLVQEFLR
ncbi:MAG TPA: hypothetical protein VL793_00105, partial [Patescibacteria group bacterium]|nr:hypothetical protein [Patescibacteria group bacterium]